MKEIYNLAKNFHFQQISLSWDNQNIGITQKIKSTSQKNY